MAQLNIDAKNAIQEIRNLIRELENVRGAAKKMQSTSVSSFKGLESSVSSLNTKIGSLNTKIGSMRSVLLANTVAVNKNTKSINSSSKAYKNNTGAVDKNQQAIKKGTQANNKFDLSLKSIVRGGILLQLSRMLLSLAEDVYSNIKTFDSLGFTLEKITGNTFDYENSQRFLLRITKAYGVELVTTTTRWARFLAAAQESGLALRDTENIFESMTKASAVLGLQTDELASVYLALEQMLSKGKVTTEELRRQLGERLPGAMGIMAASMGVTIPVLDKMLKKGEVLSAEVLPDFALAVERAYGIENADKIETLISKQNRLTASWQTFIKNISEGDSVIKKVLGGLLEFLDQVIEDWDKLLMDDKQRLRLDISKEEDEFKKSLDRSTKRYIDFISTVNEQDISLDRQQKILEEQLKTAIGKEREAIQNNIDEIARIRAVKGKEVVEREKEIAKERIKTVYNEYLQSKEIYDKLYKEQEESRKKAAKAPKVITGFNTKPDVQTPFDTQALDKARANLIKFEAEYNVLRKLIEVSNVQIIPDEEVKETKRKLRDIKEYWLETMNEIASGVLEATSNRANDDTLDLSERIKAVKKAAELEIYIKRNEYKIEERDRAIKLESEIESINDSVARGTLTRKEGNEHIKQLESEKSEYLVLKATETSNEIIKINQETYDELGKMTDDFNKNRIIDNTSDIFNKRVIEAKRIFNESRKTKRDEEQLEKELASIAIDSANAIINAKINLLKEEIRILQASGDAVDEYVLRLQQQINKLEAQKQVNPIDPNEWGEVFDAALDIARDFNASVGDLFDAGFERRIENINAEIQAEEEKYDKLIALAEGDEEQQKTLERNKADRIKKLERERLKEEQKQAKARKKFAILDIGISTAKAIMGIWADFPKFDFGATAAIMTGVISALGAAQIAAVLATPIPQYKEGVTNLGKNQVAIINDGSYKEYVERKGKILSTNKKNAVVNLEKGDTVYKNYDDMISRSSLFRVKNMFALSQQERLQEKEQFKKDLVESLQKAKFNNNIKLQAIIKDTRYKESLSRWN